MLEVGLFYSKVSSIKMNAVAEGMWFASDL